MAWWKILIIVVCSVLIFACLLSVVIAEIQIRMFLKPGSFWWNAVPWESNSHLPKDEFEAQRMANEKRIRDSAIHWGANTKTCDWYIKNDAGITLHAQFHKANAQTHRWVICVHGYKGTIGNIMCYGMNYHEKGWNVLLPENRTTGHSEGKYIGMGWLDKDDIMLWIKKIITDDPAAEIVLHGESMGCATVFMLSGDRPPANVKCIVGDCGYTSVWDMFAKVMKTSMGLPAFPLLYTSSALSKVQLGYSFKEASSLNQLKKSTLPTLFMHGEDDDFIPPSMTQENFNALDAPKEIHFFPHAAHCESEFYDPGLYWAIVWNFVGQYVKGISKNSF